MSESLFETRASRYGYPGVDVRGSFAHLPCQFFWTWLSGKAVPSGPPKKPSETLLTKSQLLLQVGYSWSLIATSIVVGAHVESWLVKSVCLVLVMNRTRGLLHTFHYTTHGASVSNMKFARILGKYGMSIPILHSNWEQYRGLHIIRHHQLKSICTATDPDQEIMTLHGFKPRMSRSHFWFRVLVAPFSPLSIARYLWARLDQNFISTPWSERGPRLVFWSVVVSACAHFGQLDTLFLYYLFPCLILTQFSSFIQHITEHVWFPPGDLYASPYVRYASLTWGRFLGRPYPQYDGSGHLRHGLRVLIWYLKAFLIDLPCRVFVFMQDLSCHDFHHRSPGVNFWAISQERANAEGLPCRWGPMTETWSVWESIRVFRDHIVYGASDPFGLQGFEARMAQRAERDPIQNRYDAPNAAEWQTFGKASFGT